MFVETFVACVAGCVVGWAIGIIVIRLIEKRSK